MPRSLTAYLLACYIVWPIYWQFDVSLIGWSLAPLAIPPLLGFAWEFIGNSELPVSQLWHFSTLGVLGGLWAFIWLTSKWSQDGNPFSFHERPPRLMHPADKRAANDTE